ncbi:hypothetical protein [Coxiella endosymbiont of Ornithodoros maritimus]|uniref:hypothetical protein n=1 Tax=Coxiella endosymbiont of Ornithodoros maritimus TaxID=1656172 RepID=UPI0022646DC4|nr:hypothetical protein [Coxiella endosymbiont of Ornithodoros maritimus]
MIPLIRSNVVESPKPNNEIPQEIYARLAEIKFCNHIALHVHGGDLRNSSLWNYLRGITEEELDLFGFLDLIPTRKTFACIIEEIGNENKDNLILEEKKRRRVRQPISF